MHKLINPTSVFNSIQYGFSQAVESRGTRQLFLSGQVGVDANQVTVAGGMYEQALKSVENIEAVLADAGATLAAVTMLRIYIKQGADSEAEQQAISQVLKEKFAEHAPASSWIIVVGLSLPEWLIEIEAQAVI
ncbi:Rid family hydrolase [Pseudomonas sp. F1_0610]|uniref:RidA family protein n=1 Tax=Pseudomonas sp. F1_0610 TaxID=3114284 RepID=UPI0039C1245E